MDILEQYKQQRPEAFRGQKPAQMADAYRREYTGMIALIMRLSGGRIRDAKQANYFLFGLAAIIGSVALILFFRLLGVGTGPDTSRIVPIAGPGNELPR